MLLYITSQQNYNLLDDICEKNNIVISKITDHNNLKKFVIQEMNNLSHCTQFAIDLSALRNTDEEIIESIQGFKTMYDSRIIIVSLETENKDLLNKLYNKGVYYFIADINKEELKEQINECITGKNKDYSKSKDLFSKEENAKEKKEYIETEIGMDYNKINPIKESDKAVTERQFSINEQINIDKEPDTIIKGIPRFVKQKSIIAVCGTQKRIGTTTQAILITRFLTSKGLKSCYVEANRNNHIVTIADYYNVNINKDIGVIQTSNIEMYYKYDLPYIMSLNYDFYILDYGIFDNVESESFIIADKRIIVAGAKTWEMDKFATIFRKVGTLNDINFIFSFVYAEEHQDIRELMARFKNTTYFSEYIPTSFIEFPCENEVIYESIFKDYLKVEVIQENTKVPKRKWFGAFKK